MLKKIIYFLILFCPAILQAEMLRSDAIENDPEREKICAARAKVKTVPFQIERKYVEAARAIKPESTFIAVDGVSPQLIECTVNGGSGKFGPSVFSPQQSFWSLIKPQQFEPGINTVQGISMAAKVCTIAVPEKINKPNFDHIIYSSVLEIQPSNAGIYKPGVKYAGVKSERYDIAVTGKSFYKTSGIELDSVDYTCLLSPMLEMKAIQIKQ